MIKRQITDAVKALHFIPPELPYDEWLSVMIAAKDVGVSFDAIDSWCSAASNYKVNDVQSTWLSITSGGGITGATLFYIAKEYGYTPNVEHDYEVIAKQQEQAQVRRVAADIEKKLKQKKAAIKAEDILNACNTVKQHPYLTKKRIEPRLDVWVNDNGWLVIPVMDLKGNIHSLQFISHEGNKVFLSNGAIKGNFYQLYSGIDSTIIICEGVATGVTLYSHYIPQSSVYVAFNAGNLLPVAKSLREAFPDSKIIIAGDCDKSGAGQQAAKAASDVVNGSYAIPKFQEHELGSDWNDRWCLDNPGRGHDF